MQLTGPGIWGGPDRAEAPGLRRAVELGVNLIDTADSYGPYVTEELIDEALQPYPDGLVIATKGGLTRAGPGTGGRWTPGVPAAVRRDVLRRLGLERIDLYQLHRVDPDVPMEDSLGVAQGAAGRGQDPPHRVLRGGRRPVEEAEQFVDIVSVQNLYNLTTASEDVLDYCEAKGSGLSRGSRSRPGPGRRRRPARPRRAAAGAPVAARAGLAARRSPVMLPIPGTSSVAHLEENREAATIELSDDEYEALTAVSG